VELTVLGCSGSYGAPAEWLVSPRRPLAGDLSTGAVAITSQNHGFAVSAETLPREVEPTHRNLNDGTLEGFRHRELPILAAQFHPEAAPGPHDANVLFQRFIESMRRSPSRMLGAAR